MAVDHGIVVEYEAAAQAPAAVTRTVAAVVGTGTAGGPSAALATPVAVGSLAAATAAFGTAGTLIDFCTNFYALASGTVVGIRYNHALTGNDLAAAVTAAIAALRTVDAVTGYAPTIILAPGLTFDSTDAGVANANTTLLKTIAAELRAIAIADAGYASRAVVKTYAGNNGGPRLLIVAQTVTTGEVASLHGSSYFAAAMARNDAEHGVRASLSNRPLPGLTSVTPVYGFDYRRAGNEADDLDNSDVTTIVRTRNGYRAWGYRATYAPSTDDRRYLQVQRVVDEVELNAVLIAQDMVDAGITDDFPAGVAANVQAYLDTLLLRGDLNGATCEPDEARNTPTALRAGHVSVQLALVPVPSAQLIRLTIQLPAPAG